MTTVDAKRVQVGQHVKFTLEQIERTNPGRVRLDWLRFTVPLDAVVKAEPALVDVTFLQTLDQPGRDLVRKANSTEVEVYTTSHAVANAGARQLVELLGCLDVGQSLRGMDFYSARTELLFAGECVGHVLAGGKSTNQAGTVHFNLWGSAMLVIPLDRLNALKSFIEQSGGRITRADLSLDVWSGLDVKDVELDYTLGMFDVRGKRPGQRNIGSWTLQHSRTFEVGSRATGKLCRVYEKGDQLFGPEANSDWVRVEVEFRDNHRVIDLDILSRPADFFAGAYPFCDRLLDEQEIGYTPAAIRTIPELADKTAEAKVSRLVRWVKTTAAPSIVAMFDLGGDLLAEIIDSERHRTPRRLLGVDPSQLRASFEKVARAFAPAPAPSFIGA